MIRYYDIDNKIFPKSCGIYFVCRADHKVLYIGSTHHLNIRLRNHNRFLDFKWHGAAYFYILPFHKSSWEDGSVNMIEESYIKKYKPILNKKFKNIHRSKRQTETVIPYIFKACIA